MRTGTLYRRRNGLDTETVDLGLLDPLRFNDRYAEAVEEFGHLQLFLESKGDFFCIPRLLHCYVTDPNFSHHSLSP